MIRAFLPLFFAVSLMLIMLGTLDYRKFESPAQRAKFNKLLIEIKKNEGDYILTFGSSVHDDGNETRPFPLLLQEELAKKEKNLPVHGVIIHGGVSRIYYSILESLFQENKKGVIRLPKLIIIEVNPRSFSAYYNNGYYTDPIGWSRAEGYYNGSPLLSIMEWGWERELPSFIFKETLLNLSNQISSYIYQNLHTKLSNFNFHKVNSLIDLINFTPTIHPIGYDLPLSGPHYGGVISHFFLEDWRKLVSLAKANNTQLFFYITPINRNFGSENATLSYRAILNKNKETLISAFSTIGTRTIDLSNLIDADSFRGYEHLKPTALQQLARRIADETIIL